jgi:hypothetical protein
LQKLLISESLKVLARSKQFFALAKQFFGAFKTIPKLETGFICAIARKLRYLLALCISCL